MRKREILILSMALIIFMLSLGVGIFAAAGRNSSISTTTLNEGFSGPCKAYREKELVIESDTELRLKIASALKKGSLTFSLVSPDGTVAYQKSGKTLYDIERIPVVKGVWLIRVQSDQAENGHYMIRAAASFD